MQRICLVSRFTVMRTGYPYNQTCANVVRDGYWYVTTTTGRGENPQEQDTSLLASPMTLVNGALSVPVLTGNSVQLELLAARQDLKRSDPRRIAVNYQVMMTDDDPTAAASANDDRVVTLRFTLLNARDCPEEECNLYPVDNSTLLRQHTAALVIPTTTNDEAETFDSFMGRFFPARHSIGSGSNQGVPFPDSFVVIFDG